jgi:hypothetical protein
MGIGFRKYSPAIENSPSCVCKWIVRFAEDRRFVLTGGDPERKFAFGAEDIPTKVSDGLPLGKN